MTAHRLDETAKGVYIISATPFTDAGDVDLDSTDRLVDFYLEKKVTGITILGMMGEAQKMSALESETFLMRVIKRSAGRVPVIVGVSNAGLDNLERLAKFSMEAGAAGVMVAPLAGMGTGQRIYNYFAEVFEALGDDIPVCFQDYPQTTGVQVSTETIIDLTVRHPQIVMLKHEDWPGLEKIREAVRKALRTLARLKFITRDGDEDVIPCKAIKRAH